MRAEEYDSNLKSETDISESDLTWLDVRNAPALEHFASYLKPMYQTIRAAHPDIPYLFLSSPGMNSGAVRRDHIRSVYEEAKAAGDPNVYFVDGARCIKGNFPIAAQWTAAIPPIRASSACSVRSIRSFPPCFKRNIVPKDLCVKAYRLFLFCGSPSHTSSTEFKGSQKRFAKHSKKRK